MKKLLLTFACMLAMGVAAMAEDVTLTFGTNPSGSSSTTYVTSPETFTVDGVTFEMNNYNPKSGQIRGNKSNGAENFYLRNTTAFPGQLKSVAILGVSLAADKTFIETGEAIIEIPVTAGANAAAEGEDMVWSDLSGSFFGIGFANKATSGTVNMTGIKIVYSVDADYIAAPSFSVNGGTVAAGTEVTINSTVAGGTVYFASSKELGRDLSAAAIKANGHQGTSFTVNETISYYAVVEKGGKFSEVTSAHYEVFSTVHAGTLADPYDVADAIKVAVFYGTEGTTESYYVEGYVSKVYNPASDGTMSYFITADESLEGDSFEIYKGKYLEGADFTEENALQLYDKIVAYGPIKLYNQTAEIVGGNLISVVSKASPELAWSDDEAVFMLGESAVADLPTLLNPHNLAVTYESSNPQVATIDAKGVVTVLAMGETTISAVFAGNAQYKGAKVSYSLNVKSAYVNTVTFDFSDPDFWTALGVEVPATSESYDFNAEGNRSVIVKDFVTITFADGNNTAARLFMSSKNVLDVRTYDGGGINFKAAKGTRIVSIAFNNGTPVTVNASEYSREGKGNYSSVTIEYEALKVNEFDDDTYFCYNTAYVAEGGLTYLREISNAEEWNAICLPFAVPNDEWSNEYKVIALDGVSSDKEAITFKALTTEGLEANTPYLIKPLNAAATEIAFILTNDVQVSAANSVTSISKGGATLVGNYGAYMVENGEYAIAGGIFHMAENNFNVLKAFRAYLALPSNLKTIRIEITDGDSTGIETIEAETIEGAVYYDLSGRKVLNPANGIFIHNGQKVLVK